MSDERGLCDNCLQSFMAGELRVQDGQSLCPACMEARKQRAAAEPVSQSRSADNAALMHGSSILATIRQSSAGKNWWVRAPLIVYFAYVMFMYWSDSGQIRYPDRYSDWFHPLNFGIHELGHKVFAPFGDWLMMAGGTILQCLAPLIAMSMFFRKMDFFSVAVCFGWLATNLFDVAIYQADSQVRVLKLVTPGGGHARHDWTFLLNSVGMLEHCQGVALLTRLFATASMLVCLISGVWLLIMMFKSEPGSRQLDYR